MLIKEKEWRSLYGKGILMVSTSCADQEPPPHTHTHFSTPSFPSAVAHVHYTCYSFQYISNSHYADGGHFTNVFTTKGCLPVSDDYMRGSYYYSTHR